MKLILVLLLHILTNITPLFAQWTQLNNELGVSIDKFEFFGNELFVLSNGVISKSSDFAESWIRLDYPKNCEINDIVSFSNSIYLATDNGVYKSSTNGATWSDRSFGFFDKRIRELEYQDSTMFAIDYYYSLYLSTDKGNSWERFSSSNFSGSGIKSLFKNGNRVYVREGGYVYQWNISNFKKIPNTRDVNYYSTDDSICIYTKGSTLYKSYVDGNNEIKIKTNVPNSQFEIKDKILYLYSSQIYTSTNYGETWESYSGELDLDKKPIKYISVDSAIFVATSSGIYKSITTKDKSWSSKNKGLSTFNIQMLAHANSSLFVSPFGKLLYASSSNGETWSKFEKGFLGKGDFNSLIVTDSTLFVSNTYGVFRSYNNGKEWSNVFSDYPINQLYNYKGIIFAATKEGLASSNDNGNSWKNIKLTYEQFSITAIGSNLICIGKDGIYISYNEGVSWKKANILSLADGYRYVKTIGKNLYAFGTLTPLISTDQGDTWGRVDNKEIIVRNLQVNDITKVGNWYYVSTSKGAYKTDTLLNNWVPYNEGLSFLPIQCRTDSSIYRIIGVNDKLYASTANNFIIERQLDSNEVVSTGCFFYNSTPTIFPNPIKSGSILNISIQDSFVGHISIELYDMFGRLHLDESVETQEFNSQIKLQNIQPGVYFIRLKSVSFNIYNKLLIY